MWVRRAAQVVGGMKMVSRCRKLLKVMKALSRMRLLCRGGGAGSGGGGKIRLPLPLLLLLPVLRYVHSLEGEALIVVDGPVQVLQHKQVLMGRRKMLGLCLDDLRCEVFWRMQLRVREVRGVWVWLLLL